jgi:hypothetical protein
LHAGLVGILAQLVEYMNEDGDYNYYKRGETTEGIYRLMDFFEVLANVKKWNEKEARP